MRRSGKFLAAALSVALVLATPLSAQATKSGLSDAKSKKTALEAENVTLTAQHEQMFDMATVKEVAAAAGMAKPTSSQITYLDITSEDSATVYQTESDRPSILGRMLSSLHHGVYAVVEYFD